MVSCVWRFRLVYARVTKLIINNVKVRRTASERRMEIDAEILNTRHFRVHYRKHGQRERPIDRLVDSLFDLHSGLYHIPPCRSPPFVVDPINSAASKMRSSLRKLDKRCYVLSNPHSTMLRHVVIEIFMTCLQH